MYVRLYIRIILIYIVSSLRICEVREQRMRMYKVLECEKTKIVQLQSVEVVSSYIVLSVAVRVCHEFFIRFHVHACIFAHVYNKRACIASNTSDIRSAACPFLCA